MNWTWFDQGPDGHQVIRTLIKDYLQKLSNATKLTIGTCFIELDLEQCAFELGYLAKEYDIHFLSSFEFPNLKNVKVVNASKICLKEQLEWDYDDLFKLSENLLKNTKVLENFVIISRRKNCSICSTNCASRYSSGLAKKLDIVTTLSASPDPVSYSELHCLLVDHKFFVAHPCPPKLSLTAGDTPAASIAQCSFHSDKQNPGLMNNKSLRGHGRSYTGRGVRNNYGNNYSPMGQAWNANNDGKVNGVKSVMVLIIKLRNSSIAPDLSSFAHVEEYKGPNQLGVGNGQGLPIQNTVVMVFTPCPSSHSLRSSFSFHSHKSLILLLASSVGSFASESS
ncbi:hypothetical protein KY284_022455 [Solanum tuberosum]|nr:hypothetical protein KY284_022455 [Solanum tuberosum]